MIITVKILKKGRKYWAAIGTVNADEASSFADVLIKASDTARAFKFNGYMIDFSE